MQYQVKIQQIDLAIGQQSLYVPQPEILQQQYLAMKAANPETPFPYWAKLWPAGIALACFIQQQPHYVTNKNVLELAAGLGLPSIVAAHKARHVLCTDISEEAMQVAAKSAALAGLQNMQCLPMNWNDIDENITADTVLLSDVNYEPEVFETLLKVIEIFLKKGTTILLATPQRLMAVPFVTRLQVVTQNHFKITVADEYGSHAIKLLVLKQAVHTT